VILATIIHPSLNLLPFASFRFDVLAFSKDEKSENAHECGDEEHECFEE
jgi:hypothetical protein